MAEKFRDSKKIKKGGKTSKMEYPVEFNNQYQEKQSRLATFFRIILVIPHYVVLYFLEIAAMVVLIISWFAILITGKNPKSLFDYMSWFMRWQTRVIGYLYLMTDKYPPFSGQVSTLPKAEAAKKA
jgi:hypothetical protein